MRAVQRAIVGIGMVLVAAIAVALLIGSPRSTGPDAAESPERANGAQSRLSLGGPPEPVDAAKDASVGTLPPSRDASLETRMVSRDLLAPPAQSTQAPADRKPSGTQKARAKPPVSGHLAAARERNRDHAEDDWTWEGREPDWSDWEDWADWDGRNHGAHDRDRDGERDDDGYAWRD